MTDSHAIQMISYGSPEVLRLVPIRLPPLEPHEVRIKTVAAAVNHTDLEIRAGNWPIRKSRPFPYVPGVEVVGKIDQVGVAVQTLGVGDQVISMMQGLGGIRAERSGGYAEHVVVAEQAVAVLPSGIDLFAMAAIGLGGVTAYEGIRRLGDLSHKRILVTGAAGGVGSMAIALARSQKARSVAGLVSRPDQIDYVRGLGADEVYVNGTAALQSLTDIDGILDTVGAATFASCIKALKPGGVFSLVGAVSGSDVRVDLWDLIRPMTLTGYSSETLDSDTFRSAIKSLANALLAGAMHPPEWLTMPLSDAPKAHSLMERRGLKGRVLLVP